MRFDHILIDIIGDLEERLKYFMSKSHNHKSQKQKC